MHHLLGLVEFVRNFAGHNQIFSGVAGASVVGGFVFWLRAVPKKISNFVVWATSIEVEVSNDSVAFGHLVRWIAEHGRRWNVRELKLGDSDEAPRPIMRPPDDDEVERKNSDWLLAPGRGSHCVWYQRWPYFISRSITNEANSNSSRVREVIRIRTPSFRRKRIATLIESLMSGSVDNRTLYTYVYGPRWDYFDCRAPRPIDSIVLPQGKREALLDDIRKFMARAAWYAERGIPYRRGYLFSGPPGTGKSSTAMAIAGLFKLDLYVLNLGGIFADAALVAAISAVPQDAVLLIEDIDAATSRVRVRTDDSKDEGPGLTLSALLNCLDGAMAKDGRVLIMTTNHPERIDPALLRPGRIDVKVPFELPTAEEAADLFARFFPGEPLYRSAILRHYRGGLSHADIQALCLEHFGDVGVCARLITNGS